jgi:peptide/nickel transport system substrate-binding protein
VAGVEVLDDQTVKVNFKDANPAWYLPFVGNRSLILPRHVFEPYKGANAREAEANTHPVGTGPYQVWDQGIKTQEVLLLGSQLVETNKIVFEINPYFREADKPYFEKIEWRGGGTQDEAARQVQSGEIDYAYGLGQLSPEVLSKMKEQGQLITNFGSNVYRILLNHTDPNQETADGERSSLEFEHPFFNDPKVRQAFAHAVDRQSLAELYGPVGQPTSNNLVAPPQYNSPQQFYDFDLQKAAALLDEAGWKDTNRDKIRDKDGVKMKVVFQAENGPALIQAQKKVKADLESLGIEVELKNEDPSILFGPCASNPNSAFCFNADLIYLWIRSSSPDPKGYMRFWTCAQIPQKANNWSGLNIERWCNEEYEQLFQQASVELDPKKRQQLFIQMNDLMIQDGVMIPTVFFADAQGINPALTDVVLTPWDNNTWNIKDWRLATP